MISLILIAACLAAPSQTQKGWSPVEASEKTRIVQIQKSGQVSGMGIILNEALVLTVDNFKDDDPAEVKVFQHRDMKHSDLVKSAKLQVSRISKGQGLAFLEINTEGIEVKEYDVLSKDELKDPKTIFTSYSYESTKYNNNNAAIFQQDFTLAENSNCEGSRKLTQDEYCLKPSTPSETGMSAKELGSPVLVKKGTGSGSADTSYHLAGVVVDTSNPRYITVNNVISSLVKHVFGKVRLAHE